MKPSDFLSELSHCELCEHRCQVNRLNGETGVCKVTLPTVASATLHPAPPESYTVFMAGCNYKCLHCQNWSISQYPDNNIQQRGFVDPQDLAVECVDQLNSVSGRRMRADRIFFSGGEPTIHLPYIEKVVEAARNLDSGTKVNFDTNGYMTKTSLMRILAFTTSITFDLKAYHEDVQLSLTGASAAPTLRNAEYIGRFAKNQLWEYRIVVIPQINESDIKPLTKFIASIDPSLPVCFLAFRPNFALENHPGSDRHLMQRCVDIARQSGLKNVYWSGHTGISGRVSNTDETIKPFYQSKETQLAGTYAYKAGCLTHPRNCGNCDANQTCAEKHMFPKFQLKKEDDANGGSI
jgi:pyruvate formate lyase activating enzyme